MTDLENMLQIYLKVATKNIIYIWPIFRIQHTFWTSSVHTDGLVPDCNNSIASALQLPVLREAIEISNIYSRQQFLVLTTLKDLAITLFS